MKNPLPIEITRGGFSCPRATALLGGAVLFTAGFAAAVYIIAKMISTP